MMTSSSNDPDTRVMPVEIVSIKPGKIVKLSYEPGKPHGAGMFNTHHRVAIVDGQPQLTEEPTKPPKTMRQSSPVLAEIRTLKSQTEVIRWGVIPEHYWYSDAQCFLAGLVTVIAGDGSPMAEGELTSFTFPDGRIELCVRSVSGGHGSALDVSERSFTYSADCVHRRSSAPRGFMILDVTLSHATICITMRAPGHPGEAALEE